MSIYEKRSFETKKRIANSLKNLMTQKDFHKISICDIVKDCKINRNSFYYHFTDIYDLLKWTFDNDAIEVVKQIDLLNDMEQAISFVLNYIDDNRKMCECVCDSLGKAELKSFFEKDFINIIRHVLDEMINENNYIISEEYKDFLIHNYTGLLASELIYYIKNEKEIDKDRIPIFILAMFHSSLEANLKEGHKLHL